MSTTCTMEERKAAMYWLASNQQQEFYEISSDFNTYKEDEHQYLKNYIGYALFGPPEFKEGYREYCDEAFVYEDKSKMDLITSIYEKIVEHGTQPEEKDILCSIVYVCLYEDQQLSKCDEYHINELINIRPIFKVQKAILKNKNTELQNWYVDTETRVYKGWTDFLSNNNLPACTMIAPKDGVYQADLKELWSDKTSKVWVETHNNNANSKYASVVDVAASVANFGYLGISVAAMFNPISAPFAIAGAVSGGLSGAWGGFRSIQHLIDRKSHDQSIADKEAVPSWLGVVGSTFGLAASGGSALLSRAIRTGSSIGKGAQIAHDAIMIGNVVINGIGIGYTGAGVIYKYKETGEISARDIFFLSTHIFFVFNSAIKFKFASEIITSDQKQILQDYEDSLRSNRHRKEFRRLVRNTGNKILNEVERNEQIIRSLTKINNKDDFFATLVRNRKVFASTDTKVSFANGQIQINDVTLISPSALTNMSKEGLFCLINQTPVNPLGGESSTSMFSSLKSKSSFGMPAPVLRAGINVLKNFYVKHSINSNEEPSEPSNYNEIINDTQNLEEQSKIMELVMEAGLTIARKYTSGNLCEDAVLAEATHYLWKVIKMNLSEYLPGVEVFEESCKSTIMKVVKGVSALVKSSVHEWVEAFKAYMNKPTPENTNDPNFAKKMETDESENQETKEKFGIKHYNDLELLDPIEVLSLPNDVYNIIVEQALKSTGSKMEEINKETKNMKRLCENELNDFFSKHPTNIDFKLSVLSKDLSGILNDIEIFENNNIIFYKLIVISVNIIQGIDNDKTLIKERLVSVMKFLWTLIVLNFSEKLPNINMLDKEHESLIMNIIIGIYKYQIDKSDKWSRAFHTFRVNYAEQ
ncbi:hypothetical protein TKK_0006124 [Trichogramma kaykai]|uniref:DUF4781 domain-containing protein n=1 Tax=Trichogramma kaykai TaxID=54128 RepID=A0ABD2XDX5_9HYME